MTKFLIRMFVIYFFMLPFSSWAAGEDTLAKYNSFDTVSGLLENNQYKKQLQALLGADFSTFYNNFDVIAAPHETTGKGLFVEGWLQDLRLENASAMVIQPDGKLYTAWVVPGNEKIEYRTNDSQSKGIQSDLLAWSKRFTNLTFNEKTYPAGFIDKEPKTRHLDTAKFNVKVTLQCNVDNKVCDRAVYEGTRKSDGAKLILKGKVIRATCDEVICPINSYEFKNKNTTYMLETVSPALVVIVNNKMVLNEKGSWSDN
ncbi:hypothetical protein PMPD1_0734 [Paramixta manurensis]|uniref:Uncharacterized protein n=1 Tax=Paramixta manurensis TaxID=2740817 RepID=A0A6M8U4X9_9GAMM|nr:hypothetical protein PMPD1_0734 [Erwiniaceae bacterium PD-1]